MNLWKQWWALARFELNTNWMFALLIPTILSFSHIIGYVSLSYLAMPTNYFFISILGLQVIAPQMVRQGAIPSPLEFLFTRAVERRLIWRAKTTVFYFILMISPLIGLLWNLNHPDLRLADMTPQVAKTYLHEFPGSVDTVDKQEGTFIVIPHGKDVLASWYLWIYFLTFFFTASAIVLVWPLRWGRFFFWFLLILFIFFPFLGLVSVLHHHDTKHTFTAEDAFFLYYRHPWLAWGLLLSLILPGQLWAERRFSRLEVI